LPDNLNAIIHLSSWQVPSLWTLIRQKGNISAEEMYRVFNMGIGYVIIVRAADADKAIATLKAAKQKAIVVGRIEKGTGKSVLIN
jgi:phosphoribosylformylglycinamidine cyclo-ligase